MYVYFKEVERMSVHTCECLCVRMHVCAGVCVTVCARELVLDNDFNTHIIICVMMSSVFLR